MSYLQRTATNEIFFSDGGLLQEELNKSEISLVNLKFQNLVCYSKISKVTSKSFRKNVFLWKRTNFGLSSLDIRLVLTKHPSLKMLAKFHQCFINGFISHA